jgi:hypothetical protein
VGGEFNFGCGESSNVDEELREVRLVRYALETVLTDDVCAGVVEMDSL